MTKGSKYSRIILWVFRKHYKSGMTNVAFTRDELREAAEALGEKAPKNLGDILYSFRYRKSFPEEIKSTAPEGMEWYIKGTGDASYSFLLSDQNTRIVPNDNLIVTKIPDATPEIIRSAAGSDEQALLAIVRYNRLIDIFLGLAAYSLQNHLRTKVGGIGQVEIDEIYVGVDSNGQQFIIPVEAKGHNDQIGIVQTEQDLAVCAAKWSGYTPIAIAVQFITDETVAMFQLIEQDQSIKIAREKHYRLVAAKDISSEDMLCYANLMEK